MSTLAACNGIAQVVLYLSKYVAKNPKVDEALEVAVFSRAYDVLEKVQGSLEAQRDLADKSVDVWKTTQIIQLDSAVGRLLVLANDPGKFRKVFDEAIGRAKNPERLRKLLSK